MAGRSPVVVDQAAWPMLTCSAEVSLDSDARFTEPFPVRYQRVSPQVVAATEIPSVSKRLSRAVGRMAATSPTTGSRLCRPRVASPWG